jgi:hypothetical protein
MSIKRIRYQGRVYVAATVEDARSIPDFIGFHCQRGERKDIAYEDTIGMGHDDETGSGSYGEYFPEILDSLDFTLRDAAMEQGLMEAPDRYDDAYAEWHEKVKDFLYDNGIRWIFVSENTPLTDYGDYCYAVALSDKAVLHVMEDIGVNDIAQAYVYDSKVAIPTVVELDENY